MWTPDPSIIITPEMKAEEARLALVEQFRAAIQSHVDATAQARRYDSGNSLASYDTPNQPNPIWRAEAAAFVVWRTAVWEYAYAEMDKVDRGERAIPSVDDFLAELPAIAWPDESGANE